MDDFSTRLRELLEYLNITPVTLAEKMGVQRTSFNHLLSGRNKPGFEFLYRLQSCYPSINLNWLISGIGPITDGDDLRFSPDQKYEAENQSSTDLFSNIFNPPPQLETLAPQENQEIPEPPKMPETGFEIPTNMYTPPSKEMGIDRLIIVYKNGNMVEIKH
jgi:transcriptional regulator with XRE-family HTH domain